MKQPYKRLALFISLYLFLLSLIIFSPTTEKENLSEEDKFLSTKKSAVRLTELDKYYLERRDDPMDTFLISIDGREFPTALMSLHGMKYHEINFILKYEKELVAKHVKYIQISAWLDNEPLYQIIYNKEFSLLPWEERMDIKIKMLEATLY